MNHTTITRDEKLLIMWLRGTPPKRIAYRSHLTLSTVYMALRRVNPDRRRYDRGTPDRRSSAILERREVA